METDLPANLLRMSHVLLVEDDPLMSDLYKAILTNGGIEVTHVSSGKAALATLKKLRPDLVVLDMMMPEMSGVDVLKKMRSQPKLADIPVVVSSNFADGDHEKVALAAGATKYILKSAYLPAAFLAFIRETLEELAQVKPAK